MTDQELTSRLDDLLAIEILQLARQLKAAREAQGIQSSSDYIPDAIKLLREKRDRIRDLLQR
jgi:hypothetical protein